MKIPIEQRIIGLGKYLAIDSKDYHTGFLGGGGVPLLEDLEELDNLGYKVVHIVMTTLGHVLVIFVRP